MKKIFCLVVLAFLGSGCGVSYDDREEPQGSDASFVCSIESDCVKYSHCKAKGCQCVAGKCLSVCYDNKVCVGNEKCFVGEGCFDIRSDSRKCGKDAKSAMPCAKGEVCNEGVCSTNCGVGLENCGGKCVGLSGYHLKSCVECLDGWGDCNGDKLEDGCEVNTAVDHKNCGGCGVECKSGEVCSGGVCSSGCGEGLEHCGGGCVDLGRYHLKSCVECVEGWSDCDGDKVKNGCEVNIDVDIRNCGGCGKACASGEVCNDGICSLSCQEKTVNCGGKCVDLEVYHLKSCEECLEGWGNCDGDWENGCEVNIWVDSRNCGGCGNECKVDAVCEGKCVSKCPSGQVVCDGHCMDKNSFRSLHIANCDGGKLKCVKDQVGSWMNCDGDVVNGCEIDTMSDNLHCRSCGYVCSKNTSCGYGLFRCDAGWGNCDGSWENGCEMNIKSNNLHCGGCNNVCQQNSSCSDRECICNDGYADCDRWSSGCETAKSSFGDLHIASCNGGKIKCMEGWSDCDGRWENGCEVKLDNMYDCGKCKEGYADCDGKAENGCEVRLAGRHWKSCGVCVEGWNDCDGDWSNGCEICGGCGDGKGQKCIWGFSCKKRGDIWRCECDEDRACSPGKCMDGGCRCSDELGGKSCAPNYNCCL